MQSAIEHSQRPSIRLQLKEGLLLCPLNTEIVQTTGPRQWAHQQERSFHIRSHSIAYDTPQRYDPSL